MSGLLSFPNPVNEKAARVVAGCVAAIGIVALVTSAHWLLVVLAVGFLLRVMSGPRFSPLGLLATRVVAPRLGPPTLVAGPPKRFAQGMGLAMTAGGAVLAVGFGAEGAADVVLVALIVAATLESAFAICLGCKLFGVLMAAGLVPEEVCAQCADISLRQA